MISKKLSLIEIDRGKEFYYNVFQNFLNNIFIKHYSGNSWLGAVFAERFNCTTKDLLERQVFEKIVGS